MLSYVDMFDGGMHIGAIQMTNLSARGLGGNGLRFHDRETLQVQLSGIGQVGAELIWMDGVNFGLRFDRRVNVEAFDLGGPNSGAQPFTLGIYSAGNGKPDDHVYPDIRGDGHFVRADGQLITAYGR